jgi:subtilisin family serine protease
MSNGSSVVAAATLLFCTAGFAVTHAATPGPHPRLSGFLDRLVAEHARTGEAGARALTSSRGIAMRAERAALLVPVILEPRAGRRATDLSRAAIEQRGGRIDAASRSFARAWVPVDRLIEVASHPDVARIREPLQPIPVDGLGPRLSEAVGMTGASAFQAAGHTGAGVKVAVVDLGFISLTDAIAQGELAPGTVRVNLPGPGDDDLESRMPHGTGVAEHVADMAPGVEIHCIMVSDEVDLENAADYCAANGVRIANHSVAWLNASYYDDTGPINQIINHSHDVDGVFWTLAAGNSARGHWRGIWSDANANNSLEFSGADERMDMTGGSGNVGLYLNWNQYGNSVTDLDLYVYDKNGVVVDSSTDRQNGPQDPAEGLRFFYSGTGVPYRIEIRRYAGPTPTGLDMTLFAFYGNFEYGTRASSLMDPAVAHGAFALGAIDQAVWAQANPPTESFSSEGPTTDGRLKPDLVAPDGTTCLAYGPHGGYGTSFSAPTTAGAAALLLGRDPSLTPAGLRAQLQSLARDVGAPGPDPVYGAGKLQLPNPLPIGPLGLLATSAALLAAGAWRVRRRGR